MSVLRGQHRLHNKPQAAVQLELLLTGRLGRSRRRRRKRSKRRRRRRRRRRIRRRKRKRRRGFGYKVVLGDT